VFEAIEDSLPATWQNFEIRCAQILEECGFQVEHGATIPHVRGSAAIDVTARDAASPPTFIVVECKHWASRVNQNVVSAFRTVVTDIGANTGLIVSKSGFQRGARRAAGHTNLELLDWNEFQNMFITRWCDKFMFPKLNDEAEELGNYSAHYGAFANRIRATLTSKQQAEFDQLQSQFDLLTMTLLIIASPVVGKEDVSKAWANLSGRVHMYLPSNLQNQLLSVDSKAARPLLEALTSIAKFAIGEFENVTR
jgi:hypothetical protein